MNTRQPLKLVYNIPKMRKVRHIHFIGIGGSGMGGIAEVLIYQGYKISGSDLLQNIITKRLSSLGATIYFNHCQNNITGSNVVVVSSAIPAHNPEISAAHKACIPVINRTIMLAELMRFRYGIAVAGTHGKTTTTAMISDIYIEGGMDPTFINGGLVKSTGSHARLGHSQYLIVEADESDASLIYLKPVIAIITNIEAEHMDTYQGDFDNLKQIFINFLQNLPFYGKAILCLDDTVIRELIPNIHCSVTTYGFSKDADVRIKNYISCGRKGHFTITRAGMPAMPVILNEPGHHNALNAAAAIAVATEDNIDDKTILNVLRNFQGTARRFEYLGEFILTKNNGKISTVMLFHDYGHHPTEIDVTIKAVRNGWPEKNLIMIFQPHRYTRTRDFYMKFAKVLSQVDSLLILDIDPIGESPITGVSSYALCGTIRAYHKVNPIFACNHQMVLDNLLSQLTGNDLILVQGAGNIGILARTLAKLKLQL
ncbi:UDP-N-acetylmuramate--L-alanine ligase [Candidatus Erwinia haradaeae]|uniref:UDP-N-acetylmuramate--L-alanine ligase n=1 Tax=Candidatus Erwinia haradaeae TaxID=1922217 RepID=A0A451D8E2_9GAMM|nr:UDP-N-acetylmuramate--L-alanine ligase [Candidatus Erwinia haradaeae]VFP82043.1 UDP-N-acetylmuramate--L-alanine ligase [Candidatus Erwinia haradaeae]